MEASTARETPEFSGIIQRYVTDPDSVYNTWFVSGDERLKAFRSIRRGVKSTVDAIADNSFPNDFKGSPLEVVLTAITEQKQVFAGAAHPFYWKPKLRIPDIYESAENKKKFGQFLAACLAATREEQVLAEMHRISAANIKGLGPAAANIVYFLHPTVAPPFNTAMVNGYNALFAEKQKLGSWDSYFQMREMIVRANAQARPLLSKDLGAFAGLLFEIGVKRLPIAANAEAVLSDVEKEQAQKAVKARHTQVAAERAEESEHTRMQHQLIRIGRALGCDVHVARNDRGRSFGGESFALHTIAQLPEGDYPADVADTVGLIDVLWLERGSGRIVAAFEVEKSTSIYSGILRMEDLARCLPGGGCHFYLVAPKAREREVVAQMTRPAFQESVSRASLAYVAFDDIHENCDALCRFGGHPVVMQKLARFQPHGTVGVK